MVANSRVLLFLLLSVLAGPLVAQQARAIDPERSTLTVFAYKSGFLSFAGHDHVIAAPIVTGEVRESGGLSVRLTVNAREMKVLDPGIDAAKRAEIQRDMHAKVLDIQRFPVIEFRSTRIELQGANSWRVFGELTLRGQTRSVTVDVKKGGPDYKGAATFKQTDFSITPISVAGGTIKVKDELKIEFKIVLK